MRNEKLLSLACGHYLCDTEGITLVEAYDKLQEASEEDPYIRGDEVDGVSVWEAVDTQLVDDIIGEIDTLYDEFVKVQANPENYKA